MRTKARFLSPLFYDMGMPRPAKNLLASNENTLERDTKLRLYGRSPLRKAMPLQPPVTTAHSPIQYYYVSVRCVFEPPPSAAPGPSSQHHRLAVLWREEVRRASPVRQRTLSQGPHRSQCRWRRRDCSIFTFSAFLCLLLPVQHSVDVEFYV